MVRVERKGKGSSSYAAILQFRDCHYWRGYDGTVDPLNARLSDFRDSLISL